MTLQEIATLAVLSAEVGVSGARGRVNDTMLRLALAGKKPQEIVAALAGVTIADGFRPARPVELDDAKCVCEFARAVRSRLNEWDRQVHEADGKRTRLRRLLNVETSS